MVKIKKLDSDNQPVKGFNHIQNRQKALLCLKGILEGVIADQQLNEKEILFLDTWLCSPHNFGNDGDVIDLLHEIKPVIKNGHFKQNQLNNLKELIADVIQRKKVEYDTYEDKINELHGILAGIAADNIVNDKEISTLNNWLTTNTTICTKHPADIIARRINEILKDNIITTKEKADLLQTIKKITGQNFEETGLAHGMSTEFFEDNNIESFNHQNQCICFTGTFLTGPRTAVEAIAKERGARTSSRVTNETTALVTGPIASRDWRFTSHGRKIEKAIELQKKGNQLVIITEQTWLKFI